MTRFLAAILACVLAVGLSACGEVLDHTPEAVGQTGTLLVVADSATWEGPIGDAIREEFGAGLRTLPQPEPAFTVQRQPLSETFLPQIRRQHSVMFVGPYTANTPTSQFLRARLGEDGIAALERGGRGIFTRPNLWANNQLVVYATGPDEETIVRQIRENSSDLKSAFDAVNRRRMTRDMFARARQTDVEDQLMERHGFAVAIQHDYVLVRDTTFQTATGNAGTFIRLRRISEADSWRDLFIYYEEDPRLQRLHPDSVRVLRNRLSRQFVRGADEESWIRIEDRFPDRRPVVTDTVNLNDRFALETRGTWYLSDDTARSLGMGGPFVSYAFYDEDSGRFYLIDGMVFAPRYDKREFLRQMESIAFTFRTRGDEPAVVADRLEDDLPDDPPPAPQGD